MAKKDVVVAHQMGYRITDNGTLISFTGRIMKPHIDTRGYPVASISGDRHRHFSMHGLAAYMKFGDEYLKDGIVARHIDGNKLNFRPDNILIGTTHDNWMDMTAKQRSDIAARSQQKFTSEQIEEWRTLHLAGMAYRALQKRFGVPRSTLSYYLSKKTKKTSYSFPKQDT
jgi:hypothetical protein